MDDHTQAPRRLREVEAAALVARLTAGDNRDLDRFGRDGDHGPLTGPPCRTCGQPTMHGGDTCYGCARAAWLRLVASAPPAPPAPPLAVERVDDGGWEPATGVDVVLTAGALLVVALGFVAAMALAGKF